MSAVSTKCTDILGSETIHIHTLTHILNIIKLLLGFPGGSVVKNPPANTGDMVLIPGSGRSPGEGNGSPLQYSCPGFNLYTKRKWNSDVCFWELGYKTRRV